MFKWRLLIVSLKNKSINVSHIDINTNVIVFSYNYFSHQTDSSRTWYKLFKKKKHEKSLINQTYCIVWKLLSLFKKSYSFYFSLQLNTLLLLPSYTPPHCSYLGVTTHIQKLQWKHSGWKTRRWSRRVDVDPARPKPHRHKVIWNNKGNTDCGVDSINQNDVRGQKS